jgi:hypothetical protein
MMCLLVCVLCCAVLLKNRGRKSCCCCCCCCCLGNQGLLILHKVEQRASAGALKQALLQEGLHQAGLVLQVVYFQAPEQPLHALNSCPCLGCLSPLLLLCSACKSCKGAGSDPGRVRLSAVAGDHLVLCVSVTCSIEEIVH